MEGSKTKKLIIVIACLAVAAVVTFVFNKPFAGGGGNVLGKGALQMLCVNEKCGKAFEMSRDRFKKEVEESGAAAMMPTIQPALKCPYCNEQSAFMAKKCKKCEEVFIADHTLVGGDKCPKCGYSESEEMRNSK